MAPPRVARRHIQLGGAGTLSRHSESAWSIPFARPALGAEEEQAVLRVLRSGWLTTGNEAAAFEAEFAKAVGASQAVAVSSATAALHLGLEACGVGPGDLVATPSYSFVASAHAIRHAGAEPLFVDIEAASCNLDPHEVERACRELGTRARGEGGGRVPRVAAILPVHVAGLPCDMEALQRIARRYSLPIVEDAAHAFPTDTGSGFAGAIGDCGAYSFYANKTITTGEGGMLVCADPATAAQVRALRLHGIDRPVWQRERRVGAGASGSVGGSDSGQVARVADYDVIALGYKYNLPDTAAAIGRAQLRKATALTEQRRRIADRYLAELGRCPGLRMPVGHPGHAWHLFIVQIEDGAAVDRDELAAQLAADGIATSVHFPPLHLTSYYRQRPAPSRWQEALANTEQCAARTLSLPLFPALTEEEQSYIIARLRAILGADS